MATENLKFTIILSSTYWDKKPTCEISIGDKCYWSGEVGGTKEDPTVISFSHQCEENKEHRLILHRQGKGKNQTVVENGEIQKDQLLHIESIEIDEIDIGSLVYEGVYEPRYPEPWLTQQRELGKEQPESLKNVTCMGHDGKWTFKFESPFYMWLLENLY